jgi:hypothetical protein
MILNQLFKSVPIEQFKPSSAQTLDQLQVALNLALEHLALDGEQFDSLVDLHRAHPNWLPDVMRTFSRQSNALTYSMQQKGLTACTRTLDFQAAWLLDGGTLAEVTQLMGVIHDEYLHSLAEDTIEYGVHHPLLMIGFKDSMLSLSGAAKVLKSLFHPDGDSYEVARLMGSQMDRIGLNSLENNPVFEGYQSETAILYEQWLYPSANNAHGSVDLHKLVSSTYEAFVVNPHTVDQALQRTLNILVYAPFLKLKLQGATAPDVCTFAGLMVDTIRNYLGTRMQLSLNESISLRPQLLANLFSPFPGDFSDLSSHPDQLIGRTECITDPRKVLTKTFQGPLGSFSGDRRHNHMGVIAEGLENAGCAIDLNRIMIHSHLERHRGFPRLVQYKGTCSTLNTLLVSIETKGPPDGSVVDVLQKYIPNIEFDDLPPSAQIGYLAYRVDEFENIDAVYGDDTEQPHPACQLRRHPELKTPFLQYLERNSLLTAEVLHHFGYGSEILDELGDRAKDSLKENFLEHDLGL